jgi:hypothetical protein
LLNFKIALFAQPLFDDRVDKPSQQSEMYGRELSHILAADLNEKYAFRTAKNPVNPIYGERGY